MSEQERDRERDHDLLRRVAAVEAEPLGGFRWEVQRVLARYVLSLAERVERMESERGAAPSSEEGEADVEHEFLAQEIARVGKRLEREIEKRLGREVRGLRSAPTGEPEQPRERPSDTGGDW